MQAKQCFNADINEAKSECAVTSKIMLVFQAI